MAKAVDIEGIGATYAGKLAEIGIQIQEELLVLGAKPAGRQNIADKTGLCLKVIHNWLNRADLSQVKGIGTQYAVLLESAGIDSVPELDQQNAKNLHLKLAEVNEEKKLVRARPTEGQITHLGYASQRFGPGDIF